MKTYDNMNKKRIPVSGYFTGLVFLLVGGLCFVDIYYSYFTSEAPIESKIIMGVSITIVLYGIGCFIPSIRDSGFRYYIPVYHKRKEVALKAKKKGKELKYPGKWQNFIYQTFRNGSITEECTESWRKLKKSEAGYSFLEDCKNIKEAIDKHKDLCTKITIEFPELGVSKTFHDSEKFQCLDIGFLLFSVMAVLLVAVNVSLNYLKNFDFPVTQPPVFSVLFFMLHKLCKQKGSELAHRYLSDIDSGWKQIEERRRKEEEERSGRKEEEERRRNTVIVIDSKDTTVEFGDKKIIGGIIGNKNKTSIK